MTLSPTWIGIDVSKAWLDIASSGGEGVQRIANTMDAIAAFAATLEREALSWCWRRAGFTTRACAP
ncbi:hypothetical protein ACFSJV_02975, partial [Paradevosia shaoguanensis]